MKHFIFFAALLLAACNQNHEVAPTYAGPMAEASVKMDGAQDAAMEAYEIKRIDMQVKVADLAEAETWVRKTVVSLNGKVSGHSSYNEGPSRSTQFMLQLPVKQLDAWVKALEQQGEWQVQGLQQSTTSIAQQYVDHAQRLKTRQALEKRYTELLQQAKSMTDVLAIEEKLISIRTEIEWMQTEKNRMDDQIEYAECSLRLDEQPNAWQRLTRQAASQWRQGWHVLVNLLLFLLRIWPLLLLTGLGYWRYTKRKKQSKQAA